MSAPIQLIVGLGNPGPDYGKTRHNAGAWLVEAFAEQQRQSLIFEKKFHGLTSKIKLANHDCHLLIPTTYMNLSGQAIGALSSYYQIPPEAILVAHDELDLATGIVRFKFAGGHGGHNGLRDTIKHLSSPSFWRIRIGIDHPGSQQEVVKYVLHAPTVAEQANIDDAIARALTVLPFLAAGDEQKAMHLLHTEK